MICLKSKNSLVLVIIFLCTAGLILWRTAVLDVDAFRAHQVEIAKQSVNGSGNEIALMIDGLKTSVHLLMSGYEELLQNLAKNPNDMQAHANIASVLDRYFPEYYAFTIADIEGELLYDDFGERIGDQCATDLKASTLNRPLTDIYIHPGPSEYHFDIMLSWNPDTVESGTFFVSFKAETIARLLRNSEPADHRLLLLRSDTEGLIEITPLGSRDKIQRPIHLSEQEQKNILATRSITGTRWQLVDLPTAALFSDYQRQVVLQSLTAMLVITIICSIMLLRIRREERKRLHAEQSLHHSNTQLGQRANKLTDINTKLEYEINERVNAEKQMRKLSSVVEQTDDMVLITDHKGLVEYVNPAFESKTGYRADEIIGKKPNLISSGQHDRAFYADMWETIQDGGIFQELFVNRHKDGSIFYEEKTITPLKGAEGKISHYVATGKDVSERMEAQDRLHHLAHHDVLTNLPNRALLLDRLEHALAQAQRNESLVAVLLLDLDRFKTINDSLGHSVGDDLLKTVAERLLQCVRSSDTVARLGGDEFTIVLENVKGVRNTTIVAEKVLESLALPYHVSGHTLQTSASIGITLYPFNEDDIETLLKNADTAMYRAKNSGGNTFTFFTNDMSMQAAQRQTLESQLRHALERQEFSLHYQPRIDLANQRVAGVEALLRWKTADNIMVSPVEFIPVLEETGLIIPVGEWVLRTACLDYKAMLDSGNESMRVSVNISPRQFQNHDLVDTVIRVLQETGLDPHRLELEITESLLVENVDAVEMAMHALHELGVSIAIDDFGTGYSALSYLKRFPIDVLKVDRAFVKDLTNGPDDSEIVKAIIAMAHSLRMIVVAEGIETREQLDILRKFSCEEIQGYLYSKPLPLDELRIWLRSSDQLIENLEYGLELPTAPITRT